MWWNIRSKWMWPPSAVVLAIFVTLIRPGETQMMMPMQNPQMMGAQPMSFGGNPFMFSPQQQMQQSNPFMMTQAQPGFQQQAFFPQGQMQPFSPFDQQQQQQQFFGFPQQTQFTVPSTAQTGTATTTTTTTASPVLSDSSSKTTATTSAPDDKSATSATTTAAPDIVGDKKPKEDDTRALPSGTPSSASTASTSQALPKSQLFQINAQIFDPQSLATLKSQVKLSRFQIWWLTNKILAGVEERMKPDYVFMMPSPFQQGIPSVNISQVLAAPTVRHEVLRALIDAAPGMIPSQLAVLLARIRVGEPMIVRNIVGSADPRKLLALVNPREIQKQIGTIIRTITEMPETGRFGITSTQAKVLPKNVLSSWLKFTNATRWTAKDLTGQSPLGARFELPLAVLGLTCQHIRTLPPPDVPLVLSFLRRELYGVRAFQDVGFPMNLRHCILQKLLEYLATKSAQGQGGGQGHVLDNLNPGEIKAIGGEVLSAIPIAALKNANQETQFYILNEIGKIDPISLTKYAPLKKLQWYGRTLFGEPEPEPVDTSSIDDQTAPVEGRSASGDDTSSSDISTDSSQDSCPADDINCKGDLMADESKPAGSKTTSQATAASKLNTTASGSLLSNVSSADSGSPKDRRKRLHSPVEEKASKLGRMGSLFCYSSPILKTSWEPDTIKDLLDSKETFGAKTCCMSRSMRSQWNKLLKATYGQNVTAWSEFDLIGIGDLAVALSDRDIRAISVRNLSRVASSLIKQTGFAAMIEVPGKDKKINFVDACMDLLGDDDEAEAFRKAQKNYFRHLSHAVQWMLTPQQTRISKLVPTCDGIILAGPAATGYTLDDFQQMDPRAIFECLEPIASLDWDTEAKQEMLNHFKEIFHLTSNQMTTLTLIELANLVSELSPGDVTDIPFQLMDSLDTVALLGSQITNIDTLKAIARKFSTDNRLNPGSIGIGRSVNLKTVVRSLGNILCAMNEQTVNSLFDSDPTMMLDTSPVVGLVRGCPATMLQVLAGQAVRPSNYGPPDSWTAMDVRTLGVVVAGLPPELLARIPADSMEGLTPLAMESFTDAALRALTPNQIIAITSDTAQAVNLEIADALSPEQQSALKVVLAPGRDAFVVDPRIVQLGRGKQFTGLQGDADLSSVDHEDDEDASSTSTTPEPHADAPEDIAGRSVSEPKVNGTSPEFNETSGLGDEGTGENGTLHVVEVKESNLNTTGINGTAVNGTSSENGTSTVDVPHQEGDKQEPSSSAARHLIQDVYVLVYSTLFSVISHVMRH